MDTGSSDLWVVDCACKTQDCKGLPGSGTQKRCFNSNASSTYQKNGRKVTFVYGSGEADGYLGSDTLSFGGFVDLNQTFGIITNLGVGFGSEPEDGIFGLDWPASSEIDVLPVLFRILGQLDKPLFTVFLERLVLCSKIQASESLSQRKYSAGVYGGMITYGAVDTTNCNAQVDYVPLITDTDWQIAVNRHVLLWKPVACTKWHLHAAV